MLIPGIICAYLIGSVPFAYIFTKLSVHLDIRKEGSRNAGATNVLRVAGAKTALAVLVLDILKGTLAVSLLASFFSNHTPMNEIDIRLIFASAVIIGHIWPVFMKFEGGKGVATALGVYAGLSLYVPEFRFLILTALLVWIITFAFTRYVSLGSIMAALSLPVTAALKGFEFRIVLLCVFLGVLIAFKHHSNIKKLIAKKENKVSFGNKSR